jgi:hypothetical protein
MMFHPVQERFFKFDRTDWVEISRDEAGYNAFGYIKPGVTRVEYVDSPERFIVHANTQAHEWEWIRLTNLLSADQPT